MRKFQQEIKKLSLFSLSGVLNTLVGYTLIFSFMFIGLSPYLSNLFAYTIGFFLSFFMGKHVIFRSKKKKHLEELTKYFVSFVIAYLMNFFTLHFSLKLELSSYFSQILGGGIFSIMTYLLSRTWVFRSSSSAYS